MKSTDYAPLRAGLLESTLYPDGSTTIARTNDWRGRIDTLTRSATTLADYAYIGPRVAQRSYGVPNVDYEPTYDNLGRITSADYDASIVKFDYTYVADENNIYRKVFDHRTGDPYNQYAYDDLDRLTAVTYHDSDTEAFNMDDLGNRDGNQTLRDDGTVNFTVDDDTNRYTSIGGNNISHDDAGNMSTDKDEYTYEYDYENRLVRIEDSSSVEVATHDYDALGRRIRVIDKSGESDVTTLYYHNPDWQVLAEYNGADELQRYYVYGNYIDEPLVMNDGTDDYYYVQDHLYSTVALIGYVDPAWVVVERYEYDAYGTATIFTDMTDWQDESPTTASKSAFGNPYMFTGRRLDVLDNDNLLTMHYRHRTYDTYTARFLQQDPLGSNPAGGRINRFRGYEQYSDGISLYEYVASNPIAYLDPYGLKPLFSMTGFDIQEYDIWEWVKGGFGIPIPLYLHGGLVVNGSVVDFGPEDDGALAGPGEVPHGTGPRPGESTKPLFKRKKGRMWEGPKKYKRCCKLTERNVLNCIKYVAEMWDNMYFLIGFQDCRGFKNNVIHGCCLTRKKP